MTCGQSNSRRYGDLNLAGRQYGVAIKPLFLEESTIGYKMLAFSILSLALMLVDHFSDYLDDFRSALTVFVTPIVIVADYPERIVDSVQEVVRSQEAARARINELERELIMLRAKTARMESLAAENNRLRALLGSSEKLENNVLVAELIGINPDPERHVVVIDKGIIDGVYQGQPLLDAHGLMGQVIDTSPFTSRVLLISDPSHSVPVQVVRSNLRLIAKGTGVSDTLKLMNVQDTADIKEGDLLVSSGLGNRFPTGYPVGVVSRIEHHRGEPFAEVSARPSARLDRSRHVLLVFTGNRSNPQQAEKGEGSDG